MIQGAVQTETPESLFYSVYILTGKGNIIMSVIFLETVEPPL